MRTLTLFALATCLFGCKPQAATPNTPQPPTESKVAAAMPKGAADAPVAANAPDPTEPGVVPEIPESLKHEGYAYFGLAYRRPIDYVMTISSKKETSSGSMQVIPLGVESGVAKFRVEKTGALAEQLGTSDTIECDASGVYTSETALGKLTKRHLELPSIVGPGTTWNATTNIEMQTGQTVSEEESCKAVRLESVKTKGGVYKALLTTSTGTMKVSGQLMRTVVKTWFVKNKGMVKAELTTLSGSQKQKIVFEETGTKK